MSLVLKLDALQDKKFVFEYLCSIGKISYYVHKSKYSDQIFFSHFSSKTKRRTEEFTCQNLQICNKLKANLSGLTFWPENQISNGLYWKTMIYLMIKPLYYRCQIWKDDATALLAWDQTKVVAAAVWQKKRGRLGLLQIGYVTKHKKGGSKFIAINLGIGFSVLFIIKCGFFEKISPFYIMDEAKKKRAPDTFWYG